MNFSKRIKLVLALFVLGCSLSVSAQEFVVTSEQWQQDLDVLQQTVHKDFSHLFDKITKDQWDKEVEAFREEIPNMLAPEIKVGMTRMVSLFEYGHTQIRFSTIAQDGVLPINLYHFEDGVFVEGVQKGNEKALGARVLAIEGMPIDQALQAIRPVVPAENDYYFKGYGLRFLTLPAVLHAQKVMNSPSDTVTLTLEKEGSSFAYTFEAVPLASISSNYLYTIPNSEWVSVRNQDTTPLYLKHLNEKLYFFEYLEDSKTVYVRQSSVFNDEKEPLKDFYKRLFEFIDTQDVEKLVYDVRLNGGGNNYNNKVLIKGIMARPKINTKGKFFYLIGRNTFSAAQNLSNEIENYTEAIIIGEPTAENKNFWGDAKPIRLPNSGIEANLSYAWWQDVPQWENKPFTIPHLAAAMTFDQYRNNEDPLLEKALAYTETGFILNPLDHLTQLFSEGNMEQLTIDAKRIVADDSYKFIDFESEFSKSAYRLLSAGQLEMALSIYSFVAEVYPTSAGAQYNYASGLEQAQDMTKAKTFYQKVISLEASATLKSAAQRKLAQLEKQ